MTNTINNYLLRADCLEVIDTLPWFVGKTEIDLIYLDPPFFSQKNYEVVWGDDAETRSFKDRWEGGIHHYIEWMRERCQKFYNALSPTGSFYLHCDWHASHYLKVMLDDIFGYKNFRNEIVWHYTGGLNAKNGFPKKHDVVLYYTKSDEWTFNIERIAYAETSGYAKSGITSKAGKKYMPNPEGKPIDDVWDIPIINPMAKERLGYPTQKPEALLERIIKASSNEGDLVLDPFCGCGTTIAVANRLNRNWIGIDISDTAIKVIQERLTALIPPAEFTVVKNINTKEDLKAVTPYEFQDAVVRKLGGVVSIKKSNDKGIDGIAGDIGIQVKQHNVGRQDIDTFQTALRRKHFKKGIMVGLEFTKGAYEEVARIKQELEIKLVEAAKLFKV